jgi:ATP-dependent RNA helicase RhlE
MFSATFSKDIKSLAKSMLNNPQVIEAELGNTVVDRVTQHIHPVDDERKTELLIHLLRKQKWSQMLVFTRTKRGADSLVKELENIGIVADSIHANRTQRARTLALEGFKNGSLTILVATDIAARGIDINHLPCVVNFDLPYVPEDYVHRIGRTGRAGKNGVAISFCSHGELKQLRSIENLLKVKFKPKLIEGFKPIAKPADRIPKAVEAKPDDEYGNFEADTEPRGRSKRKGPNKAELRRRALARNKR